jgi:hypothetical protein
VSGNISLQAARSEGSFTAGWRSAAKESVGKFDLGVGVAQARQDGALAGRPTLTTASPGAGGTHQRPAQHRQHVNAEGDPCDASGRG